jgi:hypothetical protein
METLVKHTEQESSLLYAQSDTLKLLMGENSEKFRLMVEAFNQDLTALSGVAEAVSVVEAISEENNSLATSINQLGYDITNSMKDVNSNTQAMIKETAMTQKQLSRFL